MTISTTWSPSHTPAPQYATPTTSRPSYFTVPDTLRDREGIRRLEACLREALANFEYRWPCSVTRELNALTDWIYAERRWWALESRLVGWRDLPIYRTLLAFARCRWVAYYSAQGVEALLAQHPAVKLNPNPRDPEWDFNLTMPGGEQIQFDHKTTCWPDRYAVSYRFTRAYPGWLINWLYQQQSPARHQSENRFFVCLRAADGRHNQLRAEMGLIEEAIQKWLAAPEVYEVQLPDGRKAKSAIVFVTT